MRDKSSNKWVDTHFHVFNARESVEGARYVPQYDAALANWFDKANSEGVTRGICIQPSFLGVQNNLMLSTLKAYPKLLRGIAVVRADVSFSELQSLHACGVRGIRLNLAGLSHDIPDWKRAKSLWQGLYDLGWHLEIHTDSGALPHVLKQLPTSITLVVDHMAKPERASTEDASIRALVRRSQQTQTYIKLSGAYRLNGLNAKSLAQIWMHELGVKSLLWGSDWPCTNHEQFADFNVLFALLETWVGSKHLEQVLSHNPELVYW